MIYRQGLLLPYMVSILKGKSVFCNTLFITIQKGTKIIYHRIKKVVMSVSLFANEEKRLLIFYEAIQISKHNYITLIGGVYDEAIRRR